MHYNTQDPKLRLPEYGRLVMQMVEHALEIPDKKARTAYAYEIIRVMETVNENLQWEDNYEQKLWDHLALLSDYKLDIAYPVEVRREDDAEPVKKLSYPGNEIHHLHYGRLVEQLLETINSMPDGQLRDDYVASVAIRMRDNLIEWRGDLGHTEEKVAADIEEYTKGEVRSEWIIQFFQTLPSPVPVVERPRPRRRKR